MRSKFLGRLFLSLLNGLNSSKKGVSFFIGGARKDRSNSHCNKGTLLEPKSLLRCVHRTDAEVSGHEAAAGAWRTRFLGAVAIMTVLLSISEVLHAESGSDINHTRRLVVLYSEPLDFPATEMAEHGIREVILKNPDLHIQLFVEYLDLTRFRDSNQRKALAELLRHRYADSATDLVISFDVPASNFLIENSEEVFPNTPVVMCAIPQELANKLETSPLRKRSTCVLEPTNGSVLIHAALSLMPNMKNAALVAGAFENDEIRSLDLRKSLEAFRGKITIVDLSGLSIGDLLERVRKLPGDTVIFFTTFFVDAKGRSFIPRDVLKLMSNESSFPVFGPYESYLGHGIVGGPLTSFRLQGRRAAEMAIQILRGTSADEIPFDYGSSTLVDAYDWRQLRRWNINESDLPQGSTVRYRQLSIWELYRAQAIGVITLIALESLLIITLFINLQKRKRAEMSLRESRQDLRTLAGRLISSQEEELSRLSREFHDDIVQRLAAAAIEAGMLEIRGSGIEESAQRKISSMKDQLIALSEDVHAISRQIHPSILKDLGLVRAVTSLCVRFSDRENIPVDFDHKDVPDLIREDVALCLYRVIQESLRNVAKHAKAKRVSVLLRGLDGNLFLTIVDDGIGFVPQGVRQTPGIGLASMRERVDYINGKLSVSSEPGKGTVIELSAPLEGGTHETCKSAPGR